MSTFGVDLKSHGNEIPTIVVKCISEIERRGKNVKGLYRVSGVKSQVEKLCQSFESNAELVDISDIHPNVIANVLKLYLRQLPEPLVTFELYPDFIRVAKQYPSRRGKSRPDDEEDSRVAEQIIEHLREATSKLPSIHLRTLSYLCHHLKRIAENHKINNMPSSNLGIVFGPTLLRTGRGAGALSSLVDTGHQARVVQLLITYVDAIFGQPSRHESKGDCEYQHVEATLRHSGQTSSKVIRSRTEVNIDFPDHKESPKAEATRKGSLGDDGGCNLLTINNNRDDFNRGKPPLKPSIYSSSAVIKLSGPQLIKSSSYAPSQSYGGDRTMSGRTSLYELRRQFFAPSPPPQLRSILLLTSASTSSLGPQSYQQTTVTPTSSTAAPTSISNMTKSSLTLSQPCKIKKASIVSSNTTLSDLPKNISRSSSSHSIKGSGS